jgi:hypothetical protein
LETDITEVQKKIVEMLKPLESSLKKKSYKGGEILAKKLEELKNQFD